MLAYSKLYFVYVSTLHFCISLFLYFSIFLILLYLYFCICQLFDFSISLFLHFCISLVFVFSLLSSLISPFYSSLFIYYINHSYSLQSQFQGPSPQFTLLNVIIHNVHGNWIHSQILFFGSENYKH